MKLLIITAVKEYSKSVEKILKEASVTVFSVTDTIGVKNNPDDYLLDDWFGSDDGNKYDSVFIFSFCSASAADKAIDLIELYNAQSEDNQFPIRAFLVPVEKSTK
jgi:hypothetical protein